MPFIALVNKNSGKEFHQLGLILLYKNLFNTDLKEAREQVDLMLYRNGDYMIPVTEIDTGKAAHFVHQASEFGVVCQLRSTLSNNNNEA